jgi:hypothetical protein
MSCKTVCLLILRAFLQAGKAEIVKMSEANPFCFVAPRSAVMQYLAR